jgi:multidrug transporter EmrE-like cation transporter
VLRTVLLLAGDAFANTAAHVSFKLSALSSRRVSGRGGVRGFIAWQIAGNGAGFLGVLAYTALLRGMSLHVAYPLTEGLSALGVQLAGVMLIFREKISPRAWAGTCLILCGIVFFSL